MSWLKKEVKILKRKEKRILRSEEKIVLQIGRFKLKKKLFFSVLISILVLVMGFSKIRSLHDEGITISLNVFILTLVLCSSILGLAIIHKNPKHYMKQAIIVFSSIFLVSFVVAFNSQYKPAEIAFVSMIVTTVALLIYDEF